MVFWIAESELKQELAFVIEGELYKHSLLFPAPYSSSPYQEPRQSHKQKQDSNTPAKTGRKVIPALAGIPEKVSFHTSHEQRRWGIFGAYFKLFVWSFFFFFK